MGSRPHLRDRAAPSPEAPCRACRSAEVQHHARSGRPSRASEHLPTRDAQLLDFQTRQPELSLPNRDAHQVIEEGTINTKSELNQVDVKLTQYESCKYDLWTLGRPHLRDRRSANSNQTAQTITQQRRTMHNAQCASSQCTRVD